jgi:hypothetical protein
VVGQLLQLGSLQTVMPSGHRHCEFMQVCEPPHIVPQAPQFCASPVTSVSHWPVWLQSAMPVGQVVVATQDALLWPSGQAVAPSGHTHWHLPARQPLASLPFSSVQAVPQAPQFAESVLRSWQP